LREFPVVIATVGGKGTRLYPLTLNIAKAILDMCNKATLARALAPLITQGCREIVIASKGYENSEQLNKYFKEGIGFFKELGVEPREEIRYQPNYQDRGSGDAVRYCMEYYDIEKDVLVIGGDNIMEIDLENIMKQHRETEAVLTIGLKRIEGDVSHFGVAELEGNMIKRFIEKPSPDTEPSKLINTGLYVFSPRIRKVFREMGSKVKDIGHDVIPYLVENGYVTCGYLMDGYWADVGTPGSFLETSLDILRGEVKQISLLHRYRDKQWIHPSTVERNNQLRDVYIGDNTMVGRHCWIGKDVKIENSCVGHTCQIGDGSVIRDSVVMSFTNIGKNVKINKSVIGRFATIEDGTVIDADLEVEIVGKPSERVPVIGGGVTILKDSIIGPGKRVAPIENSHKVLKTGMFVELGMDNKNIYFAEKI
jgi:NDP-sugar pyrophosphorylase family protein